MVLVDARHSVFVSSFQLFDCLLTILVLLVFLESKFLGFLVFAVLVVVAHHNKGILFVLNALHLRVVWLFHILHTSSEFHIL